MVSKFDLALEECLALLGEGKLGPEQALARYPEFKEELRPLLVAAGKVGDLGALRVRPEYRAAARARLISHMGAKPRRQAVGLALRYTASCAVLVLALATSATALAQRALPGDALYGWKLATERLWRQVQSNPIDADLFLAERRAGELRAVQGMPELELIGVNAYAFLIDQIHEDLLASPDRIDWVNQVLAAHRQSLSDMFANSAASLPDPDELFRTIFPPLPPDGNATPEGDAEGQNSEGGLVLGTPLALTPVPTLRRDENGSDEDAAGEGGWLEEAIDDLLGLP